MCPGKRMFKIMKQYNFDQQIERHGTDCVKYDGMKETFGKDNLIPKYSDIHLLQINITTAL